jgi:hypothetical protein
MKFAPFVHTDLSTGHTKFTGWGNVAAVGDRFDFPEMPDFYGLSPRFGN